MISLCLSSLYSVPPLQGLFQRGHSSLAGPQGCSLLDSLPFISLLVQTQQRLSPPLLYSWRDPENVHPGSHWVGMVTQLWHCPCSMWQPGEVQAARVLASSVWRLNNLERKVFRVCVHLRKESFFCVNFLLWKLRLLNVDSHFHHQPQIATWRLS